MGHSSDFLNVMWLARHLDRTFNANLVIKVRLLKDGLLLFGASSYSFRAFQLFILVARCTVLTGTLFWNSTLPLAGALRAKQEGWPDEGIFENG